MLQKQKLTNLIRHIVLTCATPVTFRGAVLFISMGLVGVSINVHRAAAHTYPVAPHVTIAITQQQPKKTTPAVTTPSPNPAPAPVPTPAPVPVATPKPAVSTPKVVVSTPTSSVSSLKPTSSATNTSGTGSSTSSGSTGGTNPQATSYSSTNWSGYMADTGVFTAVSASWIVPNVSGNGQTLSADGTWIGIGGVTTGDLIQTGTQDIVSANGSVSMAAFYEMLPNAAVTIMDIAVSPGDSMSATITEIGAGTWTIAIVDNTDNDSYTTTVAYTSGNSSAEWIEEDPSYSNGTQVPFDTFGSVSFSGAAATVNGKNVALSVINASSITLVTTTGKALAVPSAIVAASNGFSVTQQ